MCNLIASCLFPASWTSILDIICKHEAAVHTPRSESPMGWRVGHITRPSQALFHRLCVHVVSMFFFVVFSYSLFPTQLAMGKATLMAVAPPLAGTDKSAIAGILVETLSGNEAVVPSCTDQQSQTNRLALQSHRGTSPHGGPHQEFKPYHEMFPSKICERSPNYHQLLCKIS